MGGTRQIGIQHQPCRRAVETVAGASLSVRGAGAQISRREEGPETVRTLSR